MANHWRRSVASLLEEFTSTELNYWIAFYHLEPFPETRADYHCGIIASTIANCHRSKESRAFSPQDFIPNWEPRPQQTIDEVRAFFKALATK